MAVAAGRDRPWDAPTTVTFAACIGGVVRCCSRWSTRSRRPSIGGARDRPGDGELGADGVPALGLGLHPIIGRVGDKGRRRADAVVALIALAAGSLMAAVATSIGVRSRPGWSRASVAACRRPFGIIRDEFPATASLARSARRRRSPSVGGVGLAIAGPLVEALSYHWLFWIPMVMTVVAAVAALWVPESPEDAQPDQRRLGAAALRVAGRAAARRQWGCSWGWSSAGVIGLFAAAAIALRPGGRGVAAASSHGRHADDAGSPPCGPPT